MNLVTISNILHDSTLDKDEILNSLKNVTFDYTRFKDYIECLNEYYNNTKLKFNVEIEVGYICEINPEEFPEINSFETIVCKSNYHNNYHNNYDSTIKDDILYNKLVNTCKNDLLKILSDENINDITTMYEEDYEKEITVAGYTFDYAFRLNLTTNAIYPNDLENYMDKIFKLNKEFEDYVRCCDFDDIIITIL